MRPIVESIVLAICVGLLVTTCKYDDLDLPRGFEDFGACAPLDAGLDGLQHECQGFGNGWMILSIHPVGERPPECVNWGPAGEPDTPTIADCVPIDISEPADGIPPPVACCNDQATPEQVVEQCSIDCGDAACRLAVVRVRAAALELPRRGPRGVVRSDLLHMANRLEDPARLQACAQTVAEADGELVAIPLGAGPSRANRLGHVRSATLHLRCSLDPVEPFVVAEASCEAPR